MSKRDDFNMVDKVASNNIWKTPPEALDPVRRYAPIGLDPCTESDNPTGAVTFFTEADDGLALPWGSHGLTFVNPPYSTLVPMPLLLATATKAEKEAWRVEQTEAKRVYLEELKDKAEALFQAPRSVVSSLIVLWALKIHTEARRGVPIIALLPCGARFGTEYWQQHILINELKAVCFVRGRIKFINGATGLPGKGNNYDSMFYGFNVDVDRFAAAFKPLGVVFEMRRHRVGVMDGFI